MSKMMYYKKRKIIRTISGTCIAAGGMLLLFAAGAADMGENMGKIVWMATIAVAIIYVFGKVWILFGGNACETP